MQQLGTGKAQRYINLVHYSRDWKRNHRQRIAMALAYRRTKSSTSTVYGFDSFAVRDAIDAALSNVLVFIFEWTTVRLLNQDNPKEKETATSNTLPYSPPQQPDQYYQKHPSTSHIYNKGGKRIRTDPRACGKKFGAELFGTELAQCSSGVHVWFWCLRQR